eukprot:gene2270-2573_t
MANELAEQRRYETERKKREDLNQDERDFIVQRQQMEKQVRQSRFEQQAALIRREAEMEERRIQRAAAEAAALAASSTSQVTMTEDSSSFIMSTSVDTIIVDDQQIKSPGSEINTDDLISYLESSSIKVDQHPSNEQSSNDAAYLIDPSFAPAPVQQQPSPPPSAPIPTAVSSPKPNIDSSEASKKYSRLRKVIIGGELFNDFMKMADNNTRRHIETCGILSGTLSNDIFKVTTLIIPKQEGTTDTCNTIEEHELFEYQLENDLLTLGWIHTHPTQDCFLSAVDVHTHCSYQYLLQEAIAVVISPMANPNFGIFRLTDPPGIQTVQKCKLKSFHPHPPVGGVPIYTKVDHVEIVWGRKYDCKVVDLRNKK